MTAATIPKLTHRQWALCNEIKKGKGVISSADVKAALGWSNQTFYSCLNRLLQERAVHFPVEDRNGGKAGNGERFLALTREGEELFREVKRFYS